MAPRDHIFDGFCNCAMLAVRFSSFPPPVACTKLVRSYTPVSSGRVFQLAIRTRAPST